MLCSLRRISHLILLALSDLQKCESSPHYRVDMNKWHEYDEKTNQTIVGWEGSIMAQTMKIKKFKTIMPDWLNENNEPILGFANQKKFWFLDSIRHFNIEAVVEEILEEPEEVTKKIERAFLEKFVKFTPYESSPKDFKKQMKFLASIFKKWEEGEL